jgi:hypothetical protein
MPEAKLPNRISLTPYPSCLTVEFASTLHILYQSALCSAAEAAPILHVELIPGTNYHDLIDWLTPC